MRSQSSRHQRRTSEQTVYEVARSECAFTSSEHIRPCNISASIPVTSGATGFPPGAWTLTWSPTWVNTSWWPIITSASSQKFECAGKSSRVCSWNSSKPCTGYRNTYEKYAPLDREGGRTRRRQSCCSSHDLGGQSGCSARVYVAQALWMCPKSRFLQA